MKKFTILLLIFVGLCVILVSTAIAHRSYTNNEICNAIYIIEGKEKARQPFGIETIECKTYDKCKIICLNTIKNNSKRFKYQAQEKDFLTFLAKRYCPPNWKIWLKNLKYYLDKEIL